LVKKEGSYTEYLIIIAFPLQ